ncbi:MAG: hypothetical protein KAG56_06580 [Sulfurovaceae bacterium]|nr:hypothetical protein [Sulfurovaceae bacterium]
MYEIIGKMVLCLILALLLGAIIGWLLSRALRSEEFDLEESTGYDEHEESEAVIRMKQMEKLYENEKSLSTEYLKTNKDLKGQLMQKNSLLSNTSETLRTLQTQKSSQGNSALVKTLEDKLKNKERELLEFEEVLIKAEETIELKDNEIKKLQPNR